MRTQTTLFLFLFCLTLTGEEKTFRIPNSDTPLRFPAAHGAHPEYGIEWWYLTGHLKSENQKRFGYQATFFRFAQSNPIESGTEHIHMAHMALTDIDGRTFYHQERINRDGWNAFAREHQLNVRNGNWTLVMEDPASERIHLSASIQNNVTFDLKLEPRKPYVIFGENGLSHKGADPDAVSYYISFTRLATSGTVKIEGNPYTVDGFSWMDHEIASKQISANLEGWDWVAIQLDDGREIKAYRLRRTDGSMDPYSRLIWIDSEGRHEEFSTDFFKWENVNYWTSPDTGATYPLTVTLTVPTLGSATTEKLLIRPIMNQQEILGKTVGFAYWEGACEVFNNENLLIGKAYLELVGYDVSLAEE